MTFGTKNFVAKNFDSGNATSLELSRSVSFDAISRGGVEKTVFWTDEKEQKLVALEQRLLCANKNWSEEQEEVLEMVSLRATGFFSCNLIWTY
jgi:hypothetical protein